MPSDRYAPGGTEKSFAKEKPGGLLWLVVVGGCLLGLFACFGCGLTGYYYFDEAQFAPPADVVGKWEQNNNLLKIKTFYEFRADGTGRQGVEGLVLHFTY